MEALCGFSYVRMSQPQKIFREMGTIESTVVYLAFFEPSPDHQAAYLINCPITTISIPALLHFTRIFQASHVPTDYS